MATFQSASLWMKLAFLFTVLGFGGDLWAMDTPGWSSTVNCSGTTKCGWYIGVEALEVIGLILVLTSLVLVLCLVLLDELKGNKIALICFVIFVLVAALCMIVGVAIYEAQNTASATYATMICVLAAVCCILAGIFGILELVGTRGSGPTVHVVVRK